MERKHELLNRIVEEGKINSDNDFCVTDFSNVILNIEITTKCNAHCIYCIYSQMGIHKDGEFIEPDFFYRITKEAYDLGIREVGLYSIGDPLCNPEIVKYIRYLKELGYMYVYLSTNGILCNLEVAKCMVEAGLDSIKFTVSAASPANYKRHHGIDGYEIVEKNIKNLFEYRSRSKQNRNFRIFIFYIITKYNVNEIEKFKENFEHYSDEIIFNNVMDGLIPMKGLKEYLFIGNNNLFQRTLPCKDLWNRIVVGVNGKTYICCMLNSKCMEAYDLKKGNLFSAFNCELIKDLRKQHLSGKVDNIICQRCISGNVDVNSLVKYIGKKQNELFSYIDITNDIKQRFCD